MPFIDAEAVAASALVFLAAAIVSAYVADWVGFSIAPFPTLMVAVAAAGATLIGLGRRIVRETGANLAWAAILATVCAWPLWIAWPRQLPVGSGSDLAHYLALIDYIERHRRLVHDVSLSAYLGEMVD